MSLSLKERRAVVRKVSKRYKKTKKKEKGKILDEFIEPEVDNIKNVLSTVKNTKISKNTI